MATRTVVQHCHLQVRKSLNSVFSRKHWVEIQCEVEKLDKKFNNYPQNSEKYGLKISSFFYRSVNNKHGSLILQFLTTLFKLYSHLKISVNILHLWMICWYCSVQICKIKTTIRDKIQDIKGHLEQAWIGLWLHVKQIGIYLLSDAEIIFILKSSKLKSKSVNLNVKQINLNTAGLSCGSYSILWRPSGSSVHPVWLFALRCRRVGVSLPQAARAQQWHHHPGTSDSAGGAEAKHVHGDRRSRRPAGKNAAGPFHLKPSGDSRGCHGDTVMLREADRGLVFYKLNLRKVNSFCQKPRGFQVYIHVYIHNECS